MKDVGGKRGGEPVLELIDVAFGQVKMTVVKKLKIVFQDPLGHCLSGSRIGMRRILFGERKGMEEMSLLEHPSHGCGNRSHVGRRLVGFFRPEDSRQKKKNREQPRE